MKMIIAFAALVAVALAAPQQSRDQETTVLQAKEHDNIGLGRYSYSFELSNGEKKQESAEVINEGQENQSLVVRGTYSWVDAATGIEYTVSYVADENGFQPIGAHIPSAA